MFKRNWIPIVFASVLVVTNLSVAESQSKPYVGEGQKPLMLKLGSENFDDEPIGRAGVRFAERIKQRTNGKIQITVYNAGQLGSARQMIESVKTGALTILIAGVGGWNPILDTVNLPYLFRDAEHADKVWNGPIGEEWNRRLVRTGVRVNGYVFRGYRNCTFTKLPVRTPADMKGVKLRVSESAVNLETWQAVGAKPTPMAWSEVYLALQQGGIDGQENPTDTNIKNSMFEVQKYLVLTGHVMGQGWFQMNDKVWQDVTPETQKVWKDTWNEVTLEIRKEVLADELKNQEFWRTKGGEVITPDVAAFRAAMKDVWKKFAPKAWGEGVYERIQAIQ